MIYDINKFHKTGYRILDMLEVIGLLKPNLLIDHEDGITQKNEEFIR